VSDEVDIFLAHHGVKGMRWGVRREKRRIAKANRKPISPERAERGRRNRNEFLANVGAGTVGGTVASVAGFKFAMRLLNDPAKAYTVGTISGFVGGDFAVRLLDKLRNKPKR
jgi:hypothetical protein